jgi:hypothetical protein
MEVCVAKGSSGLFMNIGDYKNRVVVLGFRKKSDGSLGPAEASGKIRMGDLLVGINGQYLTKLGFKQIIQLLSMKDCPFLYLRFLRVQADLQAQGVIVTYLNNKCKDLDSSRPVAIRSRYFGVYMLSNGKWKAEIADDYNMITLGVYKEEEEAARVYDAMAIHLRGKQTRLNFVPLPEVVGEEGDEKNETHTQEKEQPLKMVGDSNGERG